MRVATATIEFWCPRNVAGYTGPMPVLLSWNEGDPLAVTLQFLQSVEMETGHADVRWTVSRFLLWLGGGGDGQVLVVRRRGNVTVTLGWPGKQIELITTESALDLFLRRTYEIVDDVVPDEAVDALIDWCLPKTMPDPWSGDTDTT